MPDFSKRPLSLNIVPAILAVCAAGIGWTFGSYRLGGVFEWLVFWRMAAPAIVLAADQRHRR
jgi:hypothetical protein